MGANSNEFLLMRMEEEEGTLYVPTLSKKEIKAKAEAEASRIIEENELYIDDVLVDATRVNEYLTNFIKTLRSGIDENEV
jgi:hypothetical protein